MKNKTIIALGICLSTLLMSCGTEHFGTSRAISADQNPFSNRNASTGGGSISNNVSTASSPELSSSTGSTPETASSTTTTSSSDAVTTTPLTSGAFPTTATTPGNTPARTNATPLTSGDSSGSNGNGASSE